MASSASGDAADASQLADDVAKTLKDGERLLGPTRRPDGTLRKPIRIRAGYVPQDEVAVYKSKGALWKKDMEALQEVPPGYDPVVETKPKSKSAKRNERKKEKRQQAAVDSDNKSEQNDVLTADDSNDLPKNVESVGSKMNGLTLSGNACLVTPPSDSRERSTPEDQVQDVDKKIRALKKKIRLTEAQQQKTTGKDMKPEQVEKVSKLESWRNELKLLEDKKAELTMPFS
ncbi:hypothetical protein RD792_001971 [Penstemon davidsonii]|uniref:WIBG Mago-binding domain-containing protein n=1 Tax=Penstemon davidsonii TaxID=160366 RepID=A0ABR0DPS8_9LAMI|nr:hypothetical protein RD792_001971 [Penstemon davidsonii]